MSDKVNGYYKQSQMQSKEGWIRGKDKHTISKGKLNGKEYSIYLKSVQHGEAWRVGNRVVATLFKVFSLGFASSSKN